MRFLLRIFFFLLLFLLLRSIIRSLFAPRTPMPRDPEPPRVPVSGELKKDPVCGTYVAAATSPHENFGGEIVYFCSEECRKKYVSR